MLKRSNKGREPIPGFLAFQKLKKHVAEKLGIPNGAPPAKIASAAMKVVKEKSPDLDAVTTSKKAIEEFDSHIEIYRKML